MKIKRLFLGITLCIFFVACGGGGGGGDNVPPEPAVPPVDVPTFSAGIDDQAYTQNIAIKRFNLPEATGGKGTLVYFLTPLPDGLDFNPLTRELRGTPITLGTTTVTYMVLVDNEDRTTDTLEFSIKVEENVDPTFGRQGVNLPRFSVGEVINQVMLPEATSGNGNLNYDLVTPLPAGLEFDSSTRVLSGMPDTQGRTLIFYTVTDADGDQEELSFFIDVVDTKPNFDGRTVGVQQYIRNLVITPVMLPYAIGRDLPLTYSLAPLPDGIVFNSGTRELSGSPTMVGTTIVTYTATDADGDTAILMFNIVVREPVSSSAGICDRTQEVQDGILAKINEADPVPSPLIICSTVTPEHLAGITELALSKKSITSLQSGDFDGLSSLGSLSLYGNGLTTLPEDVFDGLSSLRILRLSNNSLATLPEGIFNGLSSLRELTLASNSLTIIPTDLFDKLSNLYYLELGGNDLTDLPEDVFEGLSSLSTLRLGGNDLTDLPEDVFDGLSNLGSLSLYGNGLTTLPEGVFDGLSSLSILNLNTNDLTILPTDVFDGVPNLYSLSLFSNSLTELQEDLFDGFSRISSLSLNGNDLTTVPADLFRGLSSLRFLNLVNPLATIPADLFDGLSSLETLWMYTNSPTLPEDLFYGLSNLNNLQLRNIPLTDLPDGLFDGLLRLETLDMRHIPLTLLRDHQDVFDGLSGLKTLYMSWDSRNPPTQNELPAICQEQTVTCRPY